MSDSEALDALAIFGGSPAISEQVHVGRPNIGDTARLMQRIAGILEQRWLTNNGKYVREFEERIATYTDVKHCIALCNATIALEVLIKALDLSGQVIVPSFTFVATAHALQWQGLTPVFCDVAPGSHGLDPTRIEQLITSETSGIIGVHLWGRPCAIEQISDIAKKHDLKLIFDAAHAFGCSHTGRSIGSFGDAEVLSFHATKFFNTFEGGAVVTDSDELATRIRLMRNFGFSDYDQVSSVGTNGKMTEVSAAMGITGLESIDDFIAVNRTNYLTYCEELRNIPGLKLIEYDEGERNNYQYIVMEIDVAITGIARDQLMHILWAENVLARRYFHPGCHRMEPYRTLFPQAGSLLPVTERVAREVLVLPTGTAVGEQEIETICAIIRLVLGNSAVVRRRLEQASA